MSGILAIAETAEQAEQAARRYPQATIVALTAAVDVWREREGRADPTIESLLDERCLGELGAAMTDVVEALSARVAELSGPLLRPFDPHGDLTLRAFFHYLKTHLDGLVIRVEQACAAVDAVQPDKILVFDTDPWRMTGLTCLDKPVLGVTQRILKRLAGERGIDVEAVLVRGQEESSEDAPSRPKEAEDDQGASAREEPRTPAPNVPPASMPSAGIHIRLMRRLRLELAKLRRESIEIDRDMQGPWPAAARSSAIPSPPLEVPAQPLDGGAVHEPQYLVLSLFSDQDWRLGSTVVVFALPEGSR